VDKKCKRFFFCDQTKFRGFGEFAQLTLTFGCDKVISGFVAARDGQGRVGCRGAIGVSQYETGGLPRRRFDG
jgi:hypothetical protein